MAGALQGAWRCKRDTVSIASVSYTHLDVYKRQFLGYLADIQGANYRMMLQNSKCLSADVSAAFDPTFPDVMEKNLSLIHI